MYFHCGLGTMVAEWLTCCATNRKVALSIADGVSGFSIDIKNFRSHCDTGNDSASNRDDYQEYFLVVKEDGLKADNLLPSCVIALNLRPLTSWNLLGLPRPVKGLFKFTFYHCGLKWHLLGRQTGGANGIKLRNIRINGRN